MAWRAMRSLVVWHRQMQDLAPRTVRELPGSVWGLKAGAGHVQSGGHFPHRVPGVGDEIVTAADAPNAPRLGLDIHAELDAVRRSRDNRVLYAISNDEMFSSYAAHGYPPFVWRPYNPNDPSRDRHREHGHLQVVEDARGDDPRPWATSRTGAPDVDAEQDRKLSAADQTLWDAVVNGNPMTTTNVPSAGGVKPREIWLVRHLRDQARVLAAVQSDVADLRAQQTPTLDYRALAVALLDEIQDRRTSEIEAREFEARQT